MKNNRKYIVVILIFLVVIVFVLAITTRRKENYLVRGKKNYEKHCANCHGDKGEGLKLLIPPLTDKIWVEKDDVACIIKNGMDGPIRVHGKEYTGRMPGNPELETDEIADIVSYIRLEFNKINVRLTLKNASETLVNCK